MKARQARTIEWREHGRWVRSGVVRYSDKACEEHAAFIGAPKFRIVPVERKGKL
jgi:hypothetical protein